MRVLTDKITDDITWYINISPVNRYLFIDIAKALGVAAIILLGVQLLPLGSDTAGSITTIMLGVFTLWGVAVVLKLFTSFTGISIRFMLDEEGATAMTDEGKMGLSYVAKQVSTMRWDPMHAGSMRAANIKPDKTQVKWSQVTGKVVDEERKIITLQKDVFGNLRLYCSEDNFTRVCGYVEDMLV